MAVDTDRLVQIAAELKELDGHRDSLLGELARIAGALGGNGVHPAVRRGRPPGSRNRPRPAQLVNGRRPRKGLATDIVEFLKRGGGAYTAAEVVEGLKLPKSKSKASTVSTTLTRLTKEGRAKKDAQRGYRAA